MFAHFPEHDFAAAILANTELALMSKVGPIADLFLPAFTGSADAAGARWVVGVLHEP